MNFYRQSESYREAINIIRKKKGAVTFQCYKLFLEVILK